MTNELIAQFKDFCNHKGWTHDEISEKIGCSRSYITRIFSGSRTPSAKILDKMEKIIKHG